MLTDGIVILLDDASLEAMLCCLRLASRALRDCLVVSVSLAGVRLLK